MGSTGHLVVNGDATLLHRARRRLDELEARWSRFVATSEVSRVNRHAGERVAVGTDTRLLFTRAVDGWRLTGGGFDPTVLGAMLRNGYDRSFDDIGADRVAPAKPSVLRTGAAHIEVDATTVSIPAGVGFDPGGIGKGLAADLVVDEMITAGAAGACVNVGGDLRVAGQPPTGTGWTVAIEHPLAAAPIARLGISDGAVATTTTLRRRWTLDGEPRHHLVDPWTGAPSTSDLALVTVVASDGWKAEVLAKAELLRGSERLFDLVGGTGAEALAVTNDGRVLASRGFARFTDGAAIADRVELTTTEVTR
jgi:thiamine biosynthesis lipoprotein